MNFNANDINKCELKISGNLIDEFEDEEDLEEDFFSLLEHMARFEASEDAKNVDKFVEVIDADKSSRKVRKSTFVWLFCDSKCRLSADRLKRVAGNPGNSSGTYKKFKRHSSSEFLFKSHVLEIGDWKSEHFSSKR